MQQYHDLMRHILDHGVRKQDRTGTGTLSVFGYQMRFDLNKGFPLVTTKKVWMKGVIHELLWFLGCYDNRYKRYGLTNIKYLVDNNVHIWDEWVYEAYKKQVKKPLLMPNFIQKIKEDNRFAMRWGSLGNVYQKQWLAWQVVEQTNPQRFEREEPAIEAVFTRQKPVFSSNHQKIVGNIYSSRYGEFVVIKEYTVKRGTRDDFSRYAYAIQFLKTGYVSRNHTKQSVLKGLIKDHYFPIVEGVGCLGDVNSYTQEDKEILYQTWVGLLKRCYSPKHTGYANYGGKSVFMDKKWLIFSEFAKEVKKIPNWVLKKTFPDEYTLDKDYFKTNKYSSKTCIWLSKEDQNANTIRNKSYLAVSPERHEYVFTSIGQFARQWGMTSASIQDCLKGRIQSYNGWLFREADIDGYSVRHVNQIREIVALLKHNPDSRRIILNAWNVAEIEKMALPPCHTMAQFYVSDGKLSCQLYQRSADVFLGVPFNIASYALLTHMVAQVCGLQPGEFVWTGGDTHLYANHLEQVETQLARELHPLPTLQLNPEIKDIFDFRYQDIAIENYQPHPAIKAPVAV